MVHSISAPQFFFSDCRSGEVASYALDQNGKLFTVKIFVKPPYGQYVTANTRLWRASGVDMQLSANGPSVQTQSLLSILIGGIAFEIPASGQLLPAAEADSEFTFFASQEEAFEPPIRNPQTYELQFNESLRGLVPAAPAESRGIKIGQVTDIRSQINAKTFKFSAPVIIQLDAQRLGPNFLDTRQGEDLSAIRHKLIDSIVAHRVRAQLRTGDLLTGAASTLPIL